MMRRLRERAGDEGGWALVTAVSLMTIMIGVGLAAFSVSDSQTRQSANQRARESMLNLTEGVLSDQIFRLSRNWPAVTPGYTDCTDASANAAQCPLKTRMVSQFDAIDFKRTTAWSTQVRDNGGTSATYYSDATASGQPHYDANGDGMVWVRAQGKLGKRSRVVVARVRVEMVPVSFPNKPFVAGSVKTGNGGGHGGRPIINLNGGTGEVRCDTSSAPKYNGNGCLGYDPDQVGGGLVQDAGDLAAAGLEPTPVNAITPELLDSLRATAKANNTYYTTSCPPNPTGKVVFVEGPVDCNYNNSTGNVNSAAVPGILVIANGTGGCNGNIDWYGVIYLVNKQNSSSEVWGPKGGGGCTVHGGIFVDGPGVLNVGSNSNNLIYDPNIPLGGTAYGTAGIVQNTWRELPGT